MSKTQTPAKTPGIAIARVLRGLGLIQGTDFRVKGEYKNGERIGTRVAVLSIDANNTVAENADAIETQVLDAGFHFNVSVYFTQSGSMWVHLANYGSRTRQTHFLSPIGRTTNTNEASPVVNEPTTAPVDERQDATEQQPDMDAVREACDPEAVYAATVSAVRNRAMGLIESYAAAGQEVPDRVRDRILDLISWTVSDEAAFRDYVGNGPVVDLSRHLWKINAL